MKAPTIDCQVLKYPFADDTTPIIPPWEVRDSEKLLDIPIELVFEAFGSTTMKGLLLLENGVNTRESKCFSYSRQRGGGSDRQASLTTVKPKVVAEKKFKANLAKISN